ncbi:MAG: cytochrome c [Alphaproteobacteria bacterium]|nr:cytochrome c [Alphaproteobacteria bacterium]
MKTERISFFAFQTPFVCSADNVRQSCRAFGLAFGLGLVALLINALLLGTPLQAQDAKVGLTGEAHAADLVQARQMLMDSVEEQMMAIEVALEGKDPKIVELQNRAYLMNILFSAFPHLFPPQTQPPKGSKDPGYQTNATAKLWQDFERFYQDVQNAAAVTLAASQAKDMPNFKDQIQKLRKGCDACHAEFMTPVTDPHGP